MSNGDYDVRVTPSLLDRLIDLDPRNSRDVLPSRAETVRALRRAVKSDLEHLLNSRNSFEDLPAEFTEARQSVLTYGLPDFTSVSVAKSEAEKRLIQAIEDAIGVFEPRLAAVSAVLLPVAATERTIRLRIDARLILDPVPEPISFDVVVPLQSGQCEVKEAS